MAISENSRKYPYHTTGGILDFRGRGGWGGGGGRVTQFGIPNAWQGGRGVSSKLPEGELCLKSLIG